eukprot:5559415-Prymnesium_polylepis.1
MRAAVDTAVTSPRRDMVVTGDGGGLLQTHALLQNRGGVHTSKRNGNAEHTTTFAKHAQVSQARVLCLVS